MSHLIGAIVGWLVGKALDLLFSRARKTDRIIAALEMSLAEKDGSIKQLAKDQKLNMRDKQRIMEALKRSSLSTDKLIRECDRPLNAILISYASQKVETASGHLNASAFIKTELARYNAKYLGGGDSLIPPASVPKGLKNSDDLREWFDSEILKGRYCKLKFLVLVDLRRKAYWNSNLPYRQVRPSHYMLGEVLTVEDVFTEDQIKDITLSDIVRSGDIGWLASDVLSAEELASIHNNQRAIEQELGNPSLRLLASYSALPKLSAVLARYGIANPDEVAGTIVDKAKYWHTKLR